MTDFNDGKIHGWNGGECPVHPKTRVLYWYRQYEGGECEAGDLSWQHEFFMADIIAFRVTKEHCEPKIIWVNEYVDTDFAHQSEDKARRNSGGSTIRIAVKYREVIEND